MEGNKCVAFFENNIEEEVPWFSLLEGTIDAKDDFIDEKENKNRRAKTERDVSLLKTYLQMKVELRNVEEVLQLNELLRKFLLAVRTKDWNINYLFLSFKSKVSS